jgi:hypothetical protein
MKRRKNFQSGRKNEREYGVVHLFQEDAILGGVVSSRNQAIQAKNRLIQSGMPGEFLVVRELTGQSMPIITDTMMINYLHFISNNIRKLLKFVMGGVKWTDLDDQMRANLLKTAKDTMSFDDFKERMANQGKEIHLSMEGSTINVFLVEGSHAEQIAWSDSMRKQRSFYNRKTKETVMAKNFTKGRISKNPHLVLQYLAQTGTVVGTTKIVLNW